MRKPGHKKKKKPIAKSIVLNRKHHARLRANQRYGLQLTPGQLERLAEQTKTGPIEKIIQNTANRKRVLLTFEGIRMDVVYDRRIKNIVTFLPAPLEETDAGETQ